MNNTISFNLSMDRLSMFKLAFSCLWHSVLGTGHVRFHDVGCDDLANKLKECSDE